MTLVAGPDSWRQRGVRTTHRGREETRAADLVQRDFAATAPNQLWVPHITYIPTWTRFLFLAVLDAHSRRIVGGAMATPEDRSGPRRAQPSARATEAARRD